MRLIRYQWIKFLNTTSYLPHLSVSFKVKHRQIFPPFWPSLKVRFIRPFTKFYLHAVQQPEKSYLHFVNFFFLWYFNNIEEKKTPSLR